MNKKGFEMSFSWIFAIIVGAIILFLAITLITKISNNQNYSNDLSGANSITILANNFEVGYETSSISKIEMPTNSRLYLNCDAYGTFGEQELILKSELYDKWSETGKGIKSENKYFFFEEPLESRGFIVLSRVFEFPFKVATLNYFIPLDKQYCFVDFERDVKKELEEIKLNLDNFLVEDSVEDCSPKSTKVCHNPSSREEDSCDLFVISTSSRKYIEKEDGSLLDYEGTALMLAAIFSNKEIYSCQFQRLMLRTSSLTELYLGKSLFDKSQGCTTNQITPLNQLSQETLAFEEPADLVNRPGLLSSVRTLESNSRGGGCQLW